MTGNRAVLRGIAGLLSRSAAVITILLIICSAALAAANIVIVDGDDPGEGFNDPTPVSPVGGNTGTTLGAQRLQLFQTVAAEWGSKLNSSQVIYVFGFWPALPCTSTEAVLGAAGPFQVYAFDAAPLPGYWYNAALAAKLISLQLSSPDNPDIIAEFNANLGQSGCLDGTHFYLGLDGNHGSDIDLYAVFLHELAHGVGFLTLTDGATGAEMTDENNIPRPSVWDHFLFDDRQLKHWDQMTDQERAASSLDNARLSWDGMNTTPAVPEVLQPGTPALEVSTPAVISGIYPIGLASFGPPLDSTGVSGEIMPVLSNSGGGNACAPFTGPDALAVRQKIALIDRGGCGFTQKVKNAQNANARAVIIADNVEGAPPPALGGSDPTVTIPAVRISQADGQTMKEQLQFRSRTHSGLFAAIKVDESIRRGADKQQRALLYAPDPFQPGSSVSHYDPSATPDQLMEPFINADQPHQVAPPVDLTLPLLFDIGW